MLKEFEDMDSENKVKKQHKGIQQQMDIYLKDFGASGV
jgi:hypothetical protein